MTPPSAGDPADEPAPQAGPALDPEATASLLAVLEVAKARGFLGPGDLLPHLHHALGFAVALGSIPDRVVDLGPGGGVPGLALALLWPDAEVVLVEATARRVEHLEESVDSLDLRDRVQIVHDRAEVVGRDEHLRGSASAVVARSFAPPAVTAECGAPLLRIGGVLVTSEPPDPGARWSRLDATDLGLSSEGVVVWDDAHYHRARLVAPCADRYPRRVGVPAKRPLF